MFMASKTNLPNLGRAPRLHGHHGVVQHVWQPAPDASISCAAKWCWWTSGRTRASTASARCRRGGLVQRLHEGRLVVVGVSAPEFAFEHVVSNVESAVGNLGIDYPVA